MHRLPITNICNQDSIMQGWICNNSWHLHLACLLMQAHIIHTLLLSVQFFYFDFGYSSTLPFPAVAGGCELALSCDLRVAASTAHFALPEAKRGMGAHMASVMLPQMVPPAIAMEWLYTGRKIPLEECERWGLVNRIVPASEVMDAGLELAGEIATSAPLSLQRMKLTFRKAWGLPLHAAVRLDVGPDVYASEDRKEGARAFLERRAPKWQGK